MRSGVDLLWGLFLRIPELPLSSLTAAGMLNTPSFLNPLFLIREFPIYRIGLSYLQGLI